MLKLLHLVRPDVALFGQKDAQQLACIRAMVEDLDVGVEVVGVPTVREDDGLALSSRNRYLSATERARRSRCRGRWSGPARAADPRTAARCWPRRPASSSTTSTGSAAATSRSTPAGTCSSPPRGSAAPA